MDVIDVERQLRELQQLPAAEAPGLGVLARWGERRRARRQAALGLGAAAIVGMSLISLIIDPAEEDPEVVSTRPATTLSPEDVARQDAMITALMAFAFRPSDQTFADLPFADEVLLGIEDRVIATRPKADLRDPAGWVVDEHSALDQLAAGGDYVVRRDTHETCVGEESPAPLELTPYRRLGIQPAELQVDTCLNWYSVDLYLDDAGRIVGITLTLWEY